mgnify:CR=1 FL=1
MSYSTTSLRTVALAGHPAAGKTTLFEALLQAGGTLQTAGTVERGSTVSDFDPMEKQRGHSMDAAIASVDHGAASGQQVHLNLIDTPGYPDFIGQAIAALAAVETALVLVNAQNGIELSTRRMMALAGERGLCRLLVVNKIDAERVDLRFGQPLPGTPRGPVTRHRPGRKRFQKRLELRRQDTVERLPAIEPHGRMGLEHVWRRRRSAKPEGMDGGS